MKILQVSHRVPYPLNEGGTIGIYNYTRGFFEAGHEVTLVTLNGIKHQIDLDDARYELDKYCKMYVFNINTNVQPIPALISLLKGSSYNVSRFYSLDFERFLSSLLTSTTFDIIQVEGTFVAMYLKVIRAHSSAPVILRQHNVEYQIWERLALNEPNRLKKWYLNVLSKRLKAFEQKILNQFDAIVPVTDDDAQLFKNLGGHKPYFVSPAGIDTNYWEAARSIGNPHYIYHLGSLEWIPNREAVLWFINEIWPSIYKIDKRFKLFIAGKGMPDFMKQMHIDGVEMVGEVEDAATFIKDKSIVVVPLQSGSGIRLKILEAMAAEKLVISTSIGAQGIPVENGKELLIANDLKSFIELFTEISSNENSFNNVRKNGYDLIQNSYSNQAVISRLIGFYNTLIKAN